MWTCEVHFFYRLLWYGHKGNHLTQWGRVLLEKLIVAYIVERFQELYWFRRFCTMFVTDPTLSLSSQLHILIRTQLSKNNYIFPSTFMSSKRLFHFRKKLTLFSDTNQHVTSWGMSDTIQQDRQCTCNLTLRYVRHNPTRQTMYV